jgi:hypothetical protein
MSFIREYLEMMNSVTKGNFYAEFLLTHGRVYPVGPKTFEGQRGEPGNCFGNATHLAMWNRDLTYVEGKVTCCGIPLDHAWCIDADGVVVDSTLTPEMLDGRPREEEYFGVPFKTEYVRRAIKVNGVYGVLDFFFARKTAPELYEMGLVDGQQWLLDQTPASLARMAKRKKPSMTERAAVRRALTAYEKEQQP